MRLNVASVQPNAGIRKCRLVCLATDGVMLPEQPGHRRTADGSRGERNNIGVAGSRGAERRRGF
jgi:hypothetical protein